jgi:putative ABC transport system ATP-binding protein
MAEDTVVVFENVSKIYRMGEVSIPALKNISLKISRSRFSMILGPSGSGKTTLLNMVGCLDQPSSGEIEVCGEKVADISDDKNL